MKYLLLLLACPAFAASALTGFPFTDEALAYTVKGPSGVALGEARLTARHTATGWGFEIDTNAGIPGFAIKDTYTSHINSDFCSLDFNRTFEHGSHKGREEETIDRSQASVVRATIGAGGGRSEFPVFDCVKDGLSLVYYTRRELGQGRVPKTQQFLFGGIRDIRIGYGGAQTIQVNGQSTITDKILCTIKNGATSISFEMYFARDAARTPLLVAVPLPLGRISMELVR